MFPILTIGRLAFPTAGLIIILGAWLSLTLVERTADRVKQRRDLIFGVAATGLLMGFIGARLTFVVQEWSAIQNNLLNIVWPLTSGYEVWGGIVLGLASAFLWTGQAPGPVSALDALLPGVVFGLMVVSLSDFAGGPGYGTLTAVPWGVTQYGVRRHPVQIYELFVGALALLTWWRASRPTVYMMGRPFLLGTAVYTAGRLFVDAFRDSPLTIGDGYHVWQIVSLLILVAALFQIGRMATLVEDM